MKELLLIRGLSGSGKTTLGNLLMSMCEFTAAQRSTDDFWVTGGKYNFEPSKLSMAHTWNQDNVERCMAEEIEFVIVTNTFSTNKELAPYLTLAEKYGYVVTVITVESGLNSDQLERRNTHKVPRMTIQKMKERWEPYRKD